MALAFLLFPCAEHAAAQETTVTLIGAVVDSASGMPVAEVAVYIDGRNFTDTTDHAGEFSVGDLLGGTHVVLLMKTGYAPDMAQFTLPEDLVGEVDVGVMQITHGPPPVAALTGTVVDSRTGQPVYGVNVGLSGQAAVATDVTGRFRITETAVGWGPNVLEFRRIGYGPVDSEFWVAEHSTNLDLDVSLVPSAISMEEVVVAGERATYIPGLTQEFYRRRRVGGGAFFDQREIEKISPRVVTDIIRRAPGISVHPGPRGNNIIEFLRSSRSCQPLLFLNGARVSKADDVDWLISPHLILGVELYQGAQIPIEFNQIGSSCGVVVIWTR